MSRPIRLLLFVSLSMLPLRATGVLAAEQPGSKAAGKEAPVDPETRTKLRAVFAKHCQAAVERTTKALLAMVDGGDPAETQRANKALEVAKQGMNKELDGLGISPRVRQQEWEKWSNEIADRAGTQYQQSKK